MSVVQIHRKLFWLITVCTACACQAFAQTSKEYQVKAAFLYNFAHFIEWPASVLPTPETPFRIGILGDDPFQGAMEATVQGETIGGHPIEVLHSKKAGDLESCQIIFISRSERAHLANILAGLDSKPILTVSETDGFCRESGGINFFIQGAKVRFEINAAAVKRRHLKLSSQLLSLGKIVETAKE